MNDLKLPKGHLSFTQIDTWLRSKDTYRKKYYGGVHFATTPAMEFGNIVTKAMERGEEWVAFIPRHPFFERELLVNVDGIPVHAFIDNSDPAINRFREQKTGKTPWTEAKVKKHKQLDLYSLLLEIEDGFVTDECDFVWVKTKDDETTVEFDGHILEGKSTKILLTGEIVEFTRIITKEEREAMRALIVRVGREIEEDFAAYKHLYVAAPMTDEKLGEMPRL